jgi:hypothetical protein
MTALSLLGRHRDYLRSRPMTKSPEFEKITADTIKSIKEDFQKSLEPNVAHRRNLDKSIVEQVEADLDSLVEKHSE